MFYVSLMVTSKQKPIVNTQRIKAYHYKKLSNHKRSEQGRKKRKKEL